MHQNGNVSSDKGFFFKLQGNNLEQLLQISKIIEKMKTDLISQPNRFECNSACAALAHLLKSKVVQFAGELCCH